MTDRETLDALIRLVAQPGGRALLRGIRGAGGSNARLRKAVAKRPGDGTDFRMHGSVAQGGPIERRQSRETP